MGINIILPLIIGMALMVSLGSQVVPSFVEQMKVAKVENRTISNQNLIKDAIVRYIKMEKKVPEDNDLKVLKDYGLLRDYHESNIFGGGYGFTIDKKKGTLKIFTTINDEGASKYFSNSFKFPNKPNCVEITTIKVNGVNVETCKDNLWETFYLLDNETFESIPKPEVGSSEWANENYTNDNLGQKLEEGKELENGYVDYVKEGDKIIEYIYDKTKDGWIKGEENIFEDNKYFPGSIVDVETLEALKAREEFPEIYNELLAKKEHDFYGSFDHLGSYFIWYKNPSDLENNNFWKDVIDIIYNKYHKTKPTTNQYYKNSSYDHLEFNPKFEYVGGVGCDLKESEQKLSRHNQLLCLINKVFNIK